MSNLQPSFLQRLWTYLRIEGSRYPLFFVMLGGYALALTQWGVKQGAGLLEFVLYNYVPAGPPSLTLLLGGMVLAVSTWLLLGSVITVVANQSLRLVMGRLSSLYLASSLVAFVPILRLPELFPLAIDNPQAKVMLSAVALAAALIAGLAVYTWRSYRPALPATEQVEAPPRRHIATVVAVVVVSGYIAAMSVLMLIQHASLATHAFDLGIQDQAFSSILQRGYPLVTLYDTGPVNQLGDHFTPIYYLIAPLYALLGDARALLVIQTVALGLAALPLFALVRHSLRNALLALALVASYLLHPALQGINSFDFHEIALAPLPLFGAFYFFERGRNGWMWVCLILAMMTKEEVALTVLAFGIYLWVIRRQTRLGWTVAAVALFTFVGVNFFVMPALGGGPDLARFADLASDGGLPTLATTVLGNPLFTARYVLLNPAKMAFLLILMLPVVLLPLRARGRWLIAVPGLAVAVLSSYPGQYDITAHYPAIMLPPLYYMTIGGLQRIDRVRWAAPLAAAIMIASLVVNSQYGYVVGRQMHHIARPTEHDRAIHRLMQQIPPSASVSTLSDFVPHLSNRDHIYLFPTVNDADFILFDGHSTANYWPLTSSGIDARAIALERLLPYLNGGSYGVVDAADGAFLFHRGADTVRNEEVLRASSSPTYDAGQMWAEESINIASDPDSSWGRAAISRARPDPPPNLIGLAYGPYTWLPLAGRYQLDFHLKLTDPPPEGEVALIDLFSVERGGIVAERHLVVEEFAVGEYRKFSLMVDIAEPLQNAEFRVLHNGQGTLWFDRVDVTYLGD